MEGFKIEKPVNAPNKSLQETKGKENTDHLKFLVEEKSVMHSAASEAIESATDGPKKEGRIRKIRKAITGGVGITLLAGSMAMGIPSAHGAEQGKRKTPTEHIEKAPQKERVEINEGKEDVKDPLYKAGAIVAEKEWNIILERAKSGNLNESELELSHDKINQYLDINPLFLKGYMNKWGEYKKQYDEQEIITERALRAFEKSKEEAQKNWTIKKVVK